MTSSKGAPAVLSLEADVSRILAATAGPAPASRNDRPVLILTIGLPGSGKSTFSRRLAPAVGAAVLESDALRRLLFDEPAYSAAESRRLFAALHAAARELLLAGRNVIVDATSLKESDRVPVYELARQTGARLLQLRFTAPPAVIEARLTRRERSPDPADSSTAGLGVMRRLAAFEEEPRQDYWTVDTHDAAAVEAALNRVVEACRLEPGRGPGGTR